MVTYGLDNPHQATRMGKSDSGGSKVNIQASNSNRCTSCDNYCIEEGPDHGKTDICFFNRLLFEVSNTRTGLTPQGKHMHFTRVAFSYHGNQLVAGDQHGNIYQLNITKNRCLCVRSAHVDCMGNGHSSECVMVYKLPREMRVREFMNCKAQTCCAVYPTYCTSNKCPQSINNKHGAS